MKIRSLDFLAQLFASRQKVESNGLNFQLALSPPKFQGKKWKILAFNFELAQNPSNHLPLIE